MAFTYTDTLLLDRDVIRFNIGDTVASAGPRPSKANFTDAEIAGVLTIEGNSTAATARLFEVLAAAWRSFALSEADGPVNFDAKGLADGYAAEAARWRRKPGGSAEAAQSLAIVNLERTDAWTDAATEYGE